MIFNSNKFKFYDILKNDAKFIFNSQSKSYVPL